MTLLKEIIYWFLHGSIPTENDPHTNADSLAVQDRKNGHSTKTNGIDFDLAKGADMRHFISDLRSIEPITKQFSSAREELLRELKNLAPSKRPDGLKK